MNTKFKMLGFATCLSLIIFNNNLLCADWDSESFASDEHLNNVGILHTEKFQNSENAVLKFLENSWCSKEKAKLLMELITLTQPNKCVEIGAFTGASTLPILAALKHVKHGHLQVIDAWSNSESIKNLTYDAATAGWWSTVDMNSVKSQFKQMVNKWSVSRYCTIVHSSSEQAASKIGLIDFLHLDGNFSEEGALLDTQLYLPKVKSGGYILLSNVFVMVGNKATKMKALWPLFDECEIICEIENSNAILFKKK